MSPRSVQLRRSGSHRAMLRHEPLEERRLLDGAGGPIGIEAISDQFSQGESPQIYESLPFGASIGGQVYVDANRNDRFEPRELALEGVTLTLTGTDSSGNSVSQTLTTGSRGYFVFRGLGAGTYSIIQEQPVGYTNGTQTVGDLGGTISTNRFDNIVVEDPTDSGFGYIFREYGTPDARKANPSSGDRVGVFDPDASLITLQRSFDRSIDSAGYQIGESGSQLVAGDWDNNGLDSIGVFDPATGLFRLNNSNGNSASFFEVTPFVYGGSGFVALAGDWNWDGSDTVGVYDPETSNFYLRNSNDSGAADAGQFTFGRPGWVPLVGDWDGDGFDGIGMYDPETATFYLRNSLSAGAPDIEPFSVGISGWQPIAGDWNDDGIVTVGVYNPETATFFLRNSNTTGVADVAPFNYGLPGMDPIVGDWDTIFPLLLDPLPVIIDDVLLEDFPVIIDDSWLDRTNVPFVFSGAIFTSASASDVLDEIHTVDFDVSEDGLIEQLAVEQLA